MKEKKADEETDDSEEEQEESEGKEIVLDEDSIEDLVRQIPVQRFNSQPDSFTPQQISPVLESRPIPQTPLETDLNEAQATQQTEPKREFQPYYNKNYYSNPESELGEYPEVMQNFSPVLEQDFSRVSQNIPRFTEGDSNWSIQSSKRDWEKKYELKFREEKKDRRRL